MMRLFLSSALCLFALISSTAHAQWTKPSWDGVEKKIHKEYPDVRHISSANLRDLLSGDKQRPIILDIRETEEFSISHLKGAVLAKDADAALVSLRNVSKQQKVIVYCSVGYRSSAAADVLRRNGYINVFNLQGGIFGWANQNNPVYRGNQRVTSVHPYSSSWGRLLAKKYHSDK